MNPSSSHNFTPKGFVEISAALNAFYIERLGQGAEELPQTRFDELNEELRQRLFADEFRLTVMTAQGLLEEVPAQRWAHPKVWAALLAGGVIDLVETDDPRLAGPLLMAHGALESLIGGTSTPRATAAATDERPSDPDLSPYLQLMIAFSRARPDLYGTKRYLKKDVLAWFAKNWPKELEGEWKASDRDRAFENNDYYPTFVQQMAGLVFMKRAQRRGGKMKGRPRRSLR